MVPVKDESFKPLAALISDPVQLADVLYCLCKEEADAKQITDEDFGRALGSDAINLAAEAFVEELFDFFPDPQVRQSLRTIIAEAQKVRKRLLDRAEQVLARFDAEREAYRLMHSFGIPPASSASTPAPSPSGNSA